MRMRFWNKQAPIAEQAIPPAQEGPEAASFLAQRVSHRRFLKMLGTGLGLAGLAGLGQASLAPRRAEANYIPGSPSDTVDTNLTIQGNLTVNGNTGLGTSNPAGKLDVAGSVYVNGVAAIGTDAVAKQAYYAP